jgi:hypothetical protein
MRLDGLRGAGNEAGEKEGKATERGAAGLRTDSLTTRRSLGG